MRITLSPPAFRVLFAQGADAATFLAFYIFIGAGVHEERNPIVLVIMFLGGIWLLAGIKVGVALWLAWRYSHAAQASRFSLIYRFNQAIRIDRWWRPAQVIGLSVAAASGIVGAGFNSASIIHSATGFQLAGVAFVLAPVFAPLASLADVVRATL